MATMDRVLIAGKQALSRLQNIEKFAVGVESDPNKQLSVLARMDMAKEIYSAFCNSLGNCLYDEEETELLAELNELQLKIDDTYFSLNTVNLKLRKNLNSLEVSSSTSVPVVNASHSHARLPVLEIQKFSGKTKDWAAYIDLYNALVHGNSTLSSIEKFQYLLTSLSIEPKALIKNLPVTSDNYYVAYKILTDRYENKRLIATAHWQSLCNANKITSDSPQALRNLVTCFSENLAALSNIDIDLRDFALFNLLLNKLDAQTKKRFEIEHSSIEMPTFQMLHDFVEKQCKALETNQLTANSSSQVSTNSTVQKSNIFKYSDRSQIKEKHSFVAKTEVPSCGLCGGSHYLYGCKQFLDKSAFERYTTAKRLQMCLNCLKSKHFLKNCPSTFSCRTCQNKHHSSLHRPDSDKSSSGTEVETNVSHSSSQGAAESQVVTSLTSQLNAPTTVLLCTARAEILDAYGHPHSLKILLDTASEASFIREKCLRRLGLPISPKQITVRGVGDSSSSSCRGKVSCIIRPTGQSSPELHIDAIVIPQICSRLPSKSCPRPNYTHIADLQLADPAYHKPTPIDMLLGAEYLSSIILPDRVIGKELEPSAISTIFGWVLFGKVGSACSDIVSSYHITVESDLEQTLKKFWEIEEVPSGPVVVPEDKICEKHFVETHRKDSTGRFIVSLPFKEGLPSFENSYEAALRRLFSLERRLDRNSSLSSMYNSFMQDYLDSGHMQLLADIEISNNAYFIPHHCVVKPDSTMTQLRVVFDASSKCLNGYSLNDTLFVGPKLQKDITEILMNFRSHAIAFVADIKQMYRQILVNADHRKYQLILWRFRKSDPVQIFQLNTVTYGVASAPFLALRTIKQVALDSKSLFPRASQVLLSDVYVDDIVTGCDSLDQAIQLQRDLVTILGQAHFDLRKWASNNSMFLSNIIGTSQNLIQTFDENHSSVKILGLQWQPNDDMFCFKVSPLNETCTKRAILSDLAKIFDPLGFLAPITFLAKHLMQVLWTLGIGWDDPPPSEVVDRWGRFKRELSAIVQLQVPRSLFHRSYKYCNIHGFGDASEKGYAAVLYFRFVMEGESIVVQFLIAKSKVSPLKRISLPRLELLAAQLVSNLMAFVLDSFRDKFQIRQIFAWSDSTVALSWIRSSPYRWQTFVSNRVTYIQERIPPSCWHYVASQENPADCASRGIFPSQVFEHSIWFDGPPWLRLSSSTWPQEIPLSDLPLPEERKTVLIVTSDNDPISSLLDRFSSLAKIQRIISYCYRFVQRCRKKQPHQGAFSSNELHSALMVLVKHVQTVAFAEDMHKIAKGERCSKSLQKLAPFIDKAGFFRVGGRLFHSDLPFNSKHPMLLPRKHRLVELLVQQVHEKYLHPGPQTLRYLLSEHFWILSARRAIRTTLSKCIRCFRANPRPNQPQMGNLPPPRVNEAKPFVHVGIDYAGPFTIKVSKVRNAKRLKAYVCLFICLATKCIHLELVSDLTSEAFIAALRRFVARRGRCVRIFSDCGTNFQGAYAQLNELGHLAAAAESIRWDFNPPSAPHFGGIWESGVKSTKTHLKRTIGAQILTFEELYTVLTQVEAILNSRPLAAMSDDPSDLNALTPGHFLSLEPLTAVPDEDVSKIPLNRLSRWQLLQRIQRDFWNRWRNEYLHDLQQRQKWSVNSSTVAVGALVLIKNELASPLQWRLGRIIKLHPGADGVVRVVTLKTTNGVFQRPVVKLCPLPNQ